MMTSKALATGPFLAFLLVACGGSQSGSSTPQVTETVVDAGAPDVAPPPLPALFIRLGGKENLAKIVDSLLANASADPELKKAFAKTTGAKAEHLKAMLVDQLCELSGGDCKYTGKTMRDAHKGMKISDSQWKAFLLDLDYALQENKIADADRAELAGLLGPLKEEMTEAPAIKK
jgi:hemoglobin